MKPDATRGGGDGIALVAVLVALALLMALVVPFVASMSFGGEAAAAFADTRTASRGSQNGRELLLGQAALGHPAIDPTPTWDTRDEYADRVELPEAFRPLQEGGRVRLGGAVEDLQRRIHLDALTPMLLGNLLGTVARLREDLTKDSTTVQLDDAGALPESGFVWIDHEVIHYAARTGNSLSGLSRGAFAELGYLVPELHEPKVSALVLDFRCILAVTWPFDGRTGGLRRERRPFATVAALAEIGGAGLGTFHPDELDLLQKLLTAHGGRETAPVWGRPERVFNDLVPDPLRPPRSLRVRSALHLGAGSTVRLRDVRTGAVEYNLVMAARNERGARDLLLASEFWLDLLLPVTQSFAAVDTVVEPLVPPPVNLNTAEAEVLAALLQDIRRSPQTQQHGADGTTRRAPEQPITRSEAAAMAADIVQLRQAAESDRSGPFRGFRDLCERVFRPRLDAAADFQAKNRWLLLYRNLLTGRDCFLEMGTAPVCFASGPWVGYRAAAAVSRSALANVESARSERRGFAVAVPGFPLESRWHTQELLEEAFRLDQRAPFWSTLPVNTGAVNPSEMGNDPSSRFFPHLIGIAYPDAGLGQARFPSTDTADSGFKLATVIAPWGTWTGERRRHDSFGTSIDPRGFDVTRDGPYRIRNTGPRDRGGQPQPNPADHGPIAHPLTGDGGVAQRFALQFWAEPEQLGDQVFWEYGDGDRDRNRIALEIRGGDVVLEVLDEAGLDPEPGAAVTSPERCAVELRLPLADLGLPPRTPVHWNASAYAARPADLSLVVDGVPRGKPRYATFLTAPVPLYDPATQQPIAGLSPQDWDQRFLDLMVESTEGFPPQGVLRIGLELFEYTSKSPGVFHCRWADSRGGRMARMRASEFRPNVNPRDPEAFRPDPLDVAPEHPVGSMVELAGAVVTPTPDTPLFVGDTRLDDQIGVWAIARTSVQNPDDIVLTINNRPGPSIGQGLDIGTVKDIDLADPYVDPNENNPQYPWPPARQDIADAFPASGGIFLLVQALQTFEPVDGRGVATGPQVNVGGVEVLRYSRRQGTRLTGIQRAYPLPGDNSGIQASRFDGQQRRFVLNWFLRADINGRSVSWNSFLNLCAFAVPISLPVQNTSTLADPATTTLSEWVQLYPEGGDENDTEWVRYDQIVDRRHLVRGDRRSWDRLWWEITNQPNPRTTGIGQLGPNSTPANDRDYGSVQATAGFIGYTPQLESDFPIIWHCRQALRFRGDPFTGTSSHLHRNSTVLPCHRLALDWGNFGAYQGRLGRQDRVTVIGGAAASGGARPAMEWHTVNWVARRWNYDAVNPGAPPGQNQAGEQLGPWPFQLAAFKRRLATVAIVGPAGNLNPLLDSRLQDRVVRFPSGELPAVYAADLPVGGPVSGGDGMRGIVDEVSVHDHAAMDALLDESFADSARSFRVRPDVLLLPTGAVVVGGDLSAAFPAGGGLCAIDGEVLAYQSRADGQFTVASNGRGLLGTTARGHDRGARVRFLTHMPAAILAGGIQPRGDALPVQALGALPSRGLLLLGQELLHYAWTRVNGDQVSLEMPRHYPPGEEPGEGGSSQGLLRGRFGTTPQGASQGEAVIGMPFRHWDRRVERADDPELAPFQITCVQSPVLWKSVVWTQETTDARVEVECLLRVDQHGTWADDPALVPGLFALQLEAGDPRPRRLDFQGSQIEARFQTVYRPGAFDPAQYRAHGWKTAPKIKDVALEYEGQPQILTEVVRTR